MKSRDQKSFNHKKVGSIFSKYAPKASFLKFTHIFKKSNIDQKVINLTFFYHTPLFIFNIKILSFWARIFKIS